MLKNLLAIDVVERAPKILDLGLNVHSSTYDEALSLSDESFDGLAVSIYERIDEALLKKLPHLKAIFILGTSDKNIDTAYCAAHNIQVLSVKHYCDQETAEWVMLEIGKFFRNKELPQSIMGRRLGIIGYGDVGKRVAALAEAFLMEVVVNTSSMPNDPRFKSKEEIFKTCDIITFHTPPQTPWLSKDIYKLSKDGQAWINTCMGEIALDGDLADFLATGRVKMIMDSIAQKSYPNLSSLAQIYSQPAFDTKDSKNRLQEKFLANIREFSN